MSYWWRSWRSAPIKNWAPGGTTSWGVWVYLWIMFPVGLKVLSVLP